MIIPLAVQSYSSWLFNPLSTPTGRLATFKRQVFIYAKMTDRSYYVERAHEKLIKVIYAINNIFASRLRSSLELPILFFYFVATKNRTYEVNIRTNDLLF